MDELVRERTEAAEGQIAMPFYLVCDVSYSMKHDMAQLNDTLQVFHKTIGSQPVVDDVARICIMTFSDSPQVCEGMCQLTAYAWARRQPDPLAVAVLRSLEESQDPVYGDGFRMSYEAARRVGVPRVFQYLAKTGRLP